MVMGASGFIGRWVARALSRGGADLTLVVRSAAVFEPVGRRWGISGRVWETDLAVAGSAAYAIATHRPAVVFSLVGYGVDRSEQDEGLSYRINRDLPGEIAASLVHETPRAEWNGARLVHAGSALEYGAVDGIADEEGPARPHTLYGRSKLAGTEAVLLAGRRHLLPSVVARLFTVYGPGEHEGRLLPTLIAAARGDAPVALSAGTQRRDFAYVEDVAEGLLRLARCPVPNGECVNLATGELRSVRDFVETAARGLGIAERRLRFGAVAVRDDEMALTGVQVERLQTLTGWAPNPSVERGVRLARAFEAGAEGARR